jgi:NAD(P)-dependent dehydrogenase (short-subunit alcohol dehydrogenase family)
MLDMIAILKTKWISPPKPVTQSFEGKTILVTGATSGIGLEAVTKFAGLGASKIIMAARDLKKGDSTKLAIEDRVGRKDQLEVWKLDMTSYESIAAFAKRAETLDQLDIAVMNAGVTKANFKQSEYGWEESVQVNTLSTILLGVLLLPKLQASQRVTGRTSVLEFVNTGLHRNAIVSPEAQKQSSILQWYNKAENFSSMSQYVSSDGE